MSPFLFKSARWIAQGLILALAMPATVVAQLSSTQRARAEHLLGVRLPCLGCHTIDGKGGAIGPDLSAVGARRSPDQIRRMLLEPQQQLPGTVMPRVPMTDDTRERIVDYLTTKKSATSNIRSQLQRVPTTPNATGAALYTERCAACHGARGSGDGANAQYLEPKPAVHADARVMSTRTDDRLFDGIFAGGVALGVSPAMPAYGQTLTREQVWSLVRYIRELCKCRQPGWANGV